MAYIFEQMAKNTKNVVTTIKTGVQGLLANASQWFKNLIGSFSKSPTVKDEKSKKLESKSFPKTPIGRMYSFMYDPKHKKTLPYYDTFPLVFPIEIYGDGFLGINLHYLPPVFRAKLMNSLYETLNNNKYDDTSRLKISYSILKASSKMKLFEPCVKRYLFSHVRSSYMNIPIEDWDMVVMLPLQRFQKASEETVWRDSVRGM